MIDPANVTHLARDLKSALKAVRNPLSSPDQHPRLLLAVVYPISLHSIAIINSLLGTECCSVFKLLDVFGNMKCCTKV